MLLAVAIMATLALPQIMAAMEQISFETPAGLSEHTYSQRVFNGLAVDCDDSWTESGGVFTSSDENQRYRFEVYPLGYGATQEIFKGLKAELPPLGYRSADGKGTGLSSTLSPRTAPDGTEYELGMLSLQDDNGNQYELAMVLCEAKNTLIEIQGNWATDSTHGETVRAQMERMLDSLEFQIGERDYVSGNTFLMSNDGSELCLNEDGSFFYYAVENDHSQMYYAGTYEVYYGQVAVDKVVSMEEYGLTMEALEDVLSGDQNGYQIKRNILQQFLEEDNTDRPIYQVCRDTWYAVILNNEKLVQTADNVLVSSNPVLYLGYYIPQHNALDLTNVNAQSTTMWTYKAATSDLDAAPTT